MKALAAALAVVTLIRLVVAATAPLAPDETYYWVWSHALATGYLDHPPMVALWIRAGTILAGQTAFGVRLLGPLAAALASCMLFDAARLLFPGTRAGVAAVMLLNASLLLGVGTVIMTPDSPLLFFWTATLWAMARIAAGGPGVWWLAAGVFGGLALDSKYTALFLWIGVGLWVLLVPAGRPWLRRWQPWAACAIGFLLFAPVLAWNAAHGWAGFVRQGGRVEDWRPARAVGFLAELVGGQIGLATPLVWALCMAGLVVGCPASLAVARSGMVAAGRAVAAAGAGVRAARVRRSGAGQLAGDHLSGAGRRGRRAEAPRALVDRRLRVGVRDHRAGVRPGGDRIDPIATTA